MTAEAKTIPDEIMAIAQKAFDDAMVQTEQANGDYIIATAIHDAVMAERKRCAPAVTFCKKILEGAFDGCDLSGMDAQDLGVECGVLEETPFDPSKHKDPHGFCESGDWWFEYSGPLAAAPKAES